MSALPENDETLLSLTAVAERRGLHYMTVYRHVRTGRLTATKQNGEWKVRLGDIDGNTVRQGHGTPGNADIGSRIPLFKDRLVAGDEAGAWAIVENCLAGGSEPSDLHHHLIVPSLNRIGDEWSHGQLAVAEEHTATAVAQRVVARLGPMLRSKGRNKGTVVLGAVAQDTHALSVSILADILRSARFHVVDLGGNTPTESFVETIANADQIRAVGLCASVPSDDIIRRTVTGIQEFNRYLPILIGGRGIDDADHARELGSHGFTNESEGIVQLFEGAISSSAQVSDV